MKFHKVDTVTTAPDTLTKCSIFFLQSQSFEEHGLTQAQRALVLTIEDGLSAVNQAESELDKKMDIPQLGSDAVCTSAAFYSLTFFIKFFCNCYLPSPVISVGSDMCAVNPGVVSLNPSTRNIRLLTFDKKSL